MNRRNMLRGLLGVSGTIDVVRGSRNRERIEVGGSTLEVFIDSDQFALRQNRPSGMGYAIREGGDGLLRPVSGGEPFAVTTCWLTGRPRKETLTSVPWVENSSLRRLAAAS
jgi:hypothetical protein